MVPEFPGTWVNPIPLVLALLMIWKEAVPQLPSSTTLSVVSPTWPLRDMEQASPPKNAEGQAPFSSSVPPKLESCFTRGHMVPSDLQGPGWKWTNQYPTHRVSFDSSRALRLSLPSSLSGKRGVPREGSNLLRSYGRGTLWLMEFECLASQCPCRSGYLPASSESRESLPRGLDLLPALCPHPVGHLG